jgi:hypothetical protein
LPPRSSRWRWTFPELAWRGATPLWRASCASVWNLSTGPISEQLCGGDGAAAGQLEQRWGCLLDALLEFEVESGDRLVHRAAAGDELARDADLNRFGLAGEPAPDALEMRSPAEHPGGDCERRVELVEVPAQPLLHPPPFVDEIVAVVDQQLDVAVDLLVGTRPTEPRLPYSDPRDRQRIDRVGLPALPSRAPLGRHQLGWYPNQVLSGRKQVVLDRSGQLPAVLNRPQPLCIELRRPDDQLVRATRDCALVEHPPEPVNCDSRKRVLVNVHSDHDHSNHAPQHTLKGRPRERTDLNRGSSHAPIRSRSRVSDSGGDTTLAGQHKRQAGNGVSRRRPSLRQQSDAATPQE